MTGKTSFKIVSNRFVNSFSKNLAILPLLAGCLSAAVAQTPTPIINDHFDKGGLDKSVWVAATPFYDSQVDVLNNAVVLINRGRLLTKFPMPPQYTVEGQFKLIGNENDQFAIYLRTDGTTVNRWATFQTGIVIEFGLQRGDWSPKGINNIHLYEEHGIREEASFPLEMNAPYTFRIVDDAKRVILYINGSAAPILSMNTMVHAGSYLGFQNREGSGGGSLISDGSKLELDYLAVIPGNSASPVLDVAKEESSAGARDPFTSGENLVNPANGRPVERPAAPTNSILELSNAVGDVRILDSRGLLLETNFDYLPRIPISDLSDKELSAVLDNGTAYAALTTFGQIRNRTVQSQAIEDQLEQIWRRGKTLKEEIQTRLEILDEMRAYNSAVRDYQESAGIIGSVEQYAKNAAANADAAAGSEAHNEGRIEHDSQIITDPERRGALSGNTVVVDTTPNSTGDHDYETKFIYNNPDEAAAYKNTSRDWHIAREQAGALEQNADNAQTAANQAANAVAHIQGTIQVSQQKCEIHAAWLASHGISLNSLAPFSYIPPLSVKNGVDFERFKMEQ